MQLLGEIFGYLAAFSGLLIYISVKRTRIFVLKMISDSLFLFNYLFLGLADPTGGFFTGAALYVIAIARSGIFYHRGRRRWADNPLWLVLFIVLTFISPILTWAGPISLLPTIGSVICVFSYYVTSTVLLRILSFFGEGLWLIYAILCGSVPAALFGVVALISIAVGMINEWRHRRKHEKHPSLRNLD